MDLHKLATEDLKSMDATALRDTEQSIRRELLNLRMDIYSAPASHVGRKRGLKKSLARLLTLRHVNKATTPAHPVAKTPAAPKTKVAKTAKTKTAAKSKAK